jgi:hypothetical protein
MTGFRDRAQRAAVCATLTQEIWGGPYWTAEGPSLKANHDWVWRSSLSTGERILICVALDLWNRSGAAEIGDLLRHLDHSHVCRIGALLVAISAGPAAIDRWLAEYRLAEVA